MDIIQSLCHEQSVQHKVNVSFIKEEQEQQQAERLKNRITILSSIKNGLT
ncbi:MAG: hypothetical protein NT086_22690 [Proteobacteria bacterium]|jgi:hypothetical protein|nr:hypothetical protein [Pseudomonadota bacterium]